MKFFWTALAALLFSINLSLAAENVDSNRTFNAKAKQFFSLKNIDSVRNQCKITTASDLSLKNTRKGEISVGGFVSTDLFWDTRQQVEGRDGGFCFYPSDILHDVNGKDINAHASFNFLALNSRVTVKFKTPDAMKAKISGMVEAWFMGMSNANMNGFALRHAFFKLDWETTSLLMGQTWHPLFTERCFPQTVAGSAGAPMQPFSRAPQIRLTQKISHCSSIMIYINSQRDFLSTGAEGVGSQYLRNSAIPEVGAQYFIEYNKISENVLTHSLLFGVGGDYKRLRPRIATAANQYTKKGINGFMAIMYAHYGYHFSKELQCGVKVKAFYGQANNEFLLLGGYAVKQYDSFELDDHVDYQYTGLNTVGSWLDLYTNFCSWEVAVFTGYTENLGSFTPVQDCNNLKSYFGRGENIAFIYRIAPRVKYTANKLQFCFEPEYTAVKYGKYLNEKGRVLNDSESLHAENNIVHAMRFLLTVTCFF